MNLKKFKNLSTYEQDEIIKQIAYKYLIFNERC